MFDLGRTSLDLPLGEQPSTSRSTCSHCSDWEPLTEAASTLRSVVASRPVGGL